MEPPRFSYHVILKLIGLSLFLSLKSYAVVSPPDEKSLRIMGIELEDRTLLNEAFIIYPSRTSWWIPLGFLSDLLRFSLQISPGESTAEGFVINEKRQFKLDLKKCVVEFEQKTERFDCAKAVVHEDDIFLELSLIERWLPITLKIDSLQSKVIVVPKEGLPLMLSRERESLLEQTRSGRGEYDPGYPIEEVPRQFLEFPVLDENLSFSAQSSSGVKNFQVRHNSLLGTEFAGLETQVFLNGRDDRLDGWQLRFSRKEREPKILGPLGARQVQLFDVDLPSLPLISAGVSGKGFLISSTPFGNAPNFETHDFYGVLLPGWEVLLYRNDVLLDRKVSDNSGRFSFVNIPLLYGQNRFKFSFFGPRGERVDQYKTLEVSADLIKPGQTDYWMGLVFVKPTPNDIARHRLALQVRQGIPKHLSLNSGLLLEKDSGENYAYLGVTGVNDLFLFSTDCAFASRGGKACAWGAQTSIHNVNLGAKYTRFFNFRSFLWDQAETNLYDILTGNLVFVVPFINPVGFTWEYERKKRIQETSVDILRNRLVTQFGPLSVNHSLTYSLGSLTDLEGRLDLNLSLNPIQFRAGMDYRIRQVQSFDVDVIVSPSGRYSLTGSAMIPTDNRSPNFGLSLAKNFQNFVGSLDFSMTSDRDFAAGMGLVFSLFSSVSEGITLKSEPQTNFGYASIKVFLDKNRNGIQDQGEPPLPKLQLTVDQREDVYATGENGVATIYSLTPYQPHDISISYRQLNNPFWKPIKSGIRIYPRPGKMFQGVLPVGVVGAVDGSVMASHDSKVKSRNRIPVQLLNANRQVVGTVKTDREGFYTFDDIPPGKYVIQLERSYLEKANLRVSPAQIEVAIDPDGSFESEKNFELVQP